MNMVRMKLGGFLMAVVGTSLIVSACSSPSQANQLPNVVVSNNSPSSVLPGQAAGSPPQTVTSKSAGSTSKASAKESGASMNLVADKPTINSGDTFLINVTVNTKNQSRGAECGLSFDPSVMQCSGVVEGPFYKKWAEDNDCTTMMNPAKPVIDNEKGSVATVGIAIMGQSAAMLAGKEADGINGNGVFLSYKMTAKPGINKKSAVRLVKSLIFDPNGTDMGQVSAGTIEIPVGNPQ